MNACPTRLRRAGIRRRRLRRRPSLIPATPAAALLALLTLSTSCFLQRRSPTPAVPFAAESSTTSFAAASVHGTVYVRPSQLEVVVEQGWIAILQKDQATRKSLRLRVLLVRASESGSGRVRVDSSAAVALAPLFAAGGADSIPVPPRTLRFDVPVSNRDVLAGHWLTFAFERSGGSRWYFHTDRNIFSRLRTEGRP